MKGKQCTEIWIWRCHLIWKISELQSHWNEGDALWARCSVLFLHYLSICYYWLSEHGYSYKEIQTYNQNLSGTSEMDIM